jgi:hypothetical protein
VRIPGRRAPPAAASAASAAAARRLRAEMRRRPLRPRPRVRRGGGRVLARVELAPGVPRAPAADGERRELVQRRRPRPRRGAVVAAAPPAAARAPRPAASAPFHPRRDRGGPPAVSTADRRPVYRRSVHRSSRGRRLRLARPMQPWSSKASGGVQRHRGVSGLKARDPGRRDAPGEVLKDRRSPRERGRMGTSV